MRFVKRLEKDVRALSNAKASHVKFSLLTYRQGRFDKIAGQHPEASRRDCPT